MLTPVSIISEDADLVLERLPSGEMAYLKPDRRCSVDDCDAPYLAKGFCRRHYKRWQAHGETATPFYRLPLMIRFDKSIDRDDSGGCWLWTGSMSNWGYGRIKNGGRIIAAHRLSYQHYKGVIPDGLFACHTCDVRRCVNPEHLFLGTVQDNTSDMVSKNRQARYERTHSAKLTKEDVVAIRVLWRSNTIQVSELARKYGISHVAMRAVISGEHWRGIEPTEEDFAWLRPSTEAAEDEDATFVLTYEGRRALRMAELFGVDR